MSPCLFFVRVEAAKMCPCPMFAATTTFTTPAVPGFPAEEPHPAPTRAISATSEIIRVAGTP